MFDNTAALIARADITRLAGFLPTTDSRLCGTDGTVVLSPPEQPASVTASVDGRQVTLQWTDPGDASGFEIEAGLAPGRRDVATRVEGATTFVVRDVPPGTYYVRVRALNEVGASPPSPEIRVVVP